MSKKRLKLTDQIRRAVDECGRTRYAICKHLDIPQPRMSRFMERGEGLSLERLDALADALRLRIVVEGPTRVPKRTGRPGRKPKRKAR